jgi:glutamate dehydrogenase
MRLAGDKAILLERTAAIAHQRIEGGETDTVVRFVRCYYEHAGPEDMVGVEPADLYGAALAHYRFGQSRQPGSTAVRIYTPRVADHGWQSSHTAVEVVMPDMPFIVDSIRMELARHGLAIHRIVHPIIDGVSHVQVEVDRQTDPVENAKVERDLLRVLGDVRAAAEDRQAMVEAAEIVTADLSANPPKIDDDELAEIETFLNWLTDDHFTLLGYREYELTKRDGADMLVQVPNTGLGILRRGSGAAVSDAFTRLPPEIRHLAREPYPLVLTKANTLATVRRPSRLDYIGIKRFDENGDVIGEHRFVGLYTQSFYNLSPWAVPLLRRKVQRVMERAALPAGGHSEKDLTGILEHHPRDELLQADDDELFETTLGILHLQERQRVRLFTRRDRFGRFFSCLIYLPRDRYNTTTRIEMQRILADALGGRNIEHQARISESVLARLHLVVQVDPAEEPEIDIDLFERQLAAAARSRADDLRDCLVDEHGEEHGLYLFRRYRDAFGAGYMAENLPRVAVDDIERLEALGRNDIGTHLYRPLEVARGMARFKLYLSRPVLVSHVLPLLENLGVRVADQRPHSVRRAGSPAMWIYDFGLQFDQLEDLDLTADLFREAFVRTWRGDMENDGFNKLVLLARLPWREITVLRAYAKYLRQIDSRFSPRYIESALTSHPAIAAQLVELFHLRFDPDHETTDREQQAAELTSRIEEALDGVASLDQDRILRSFLTLICATLRTNFYQVDPAGGGPKTHLSFKLDPSKNPNLPLPRPAYEIFVYAPHIEGIHLRGGKVARGGLRWSDRQEDFRTEVLGLMRAQMVKNAVIVPVGAKGGFVVKQPPSGRDELAIEMERCYRTFISGLLDLTDNRRGAEIITPPRVIRYDGDDPYLVVAADRGTAALSDVANEIANQYGFWLGDAFASGGSAGYDHKKLGITARGAWESVKRHFRELGIDIGSAAATVVGIGDMSGDVFGNGMLLSRQLRLVGAFNNAHIFLDPDPDPEASYRERRRLFELPRSSWGDYDPAVISPGGGVYPRTAKSIPLTSQVVKVLGIDPGIEALPPDDLIQCLLRAPVDLLWNGGIGTYVKASSETHLDVGDKANDAVRVDATSLRCQVVAEGGNLGFTQRARIEMARAGIAVNTDAIDNAAGVDCSDHEVNIKILLDPVVAAGDLTTKQRDLLLSRMTDEVAALVLSNNERQTQALANAVAQAPAMIDVHARYTRWLEHEGGLNRNIEYLPTDEEYRERKSQGEGLTQPEFAVLLAHTKNVLTQQIIQSDLPDDPFLVSELMRYFPTALQGQFAQEIERHRLRREIIATSLASSMVDYQGITYAYRLADETGTPIADIARAFTVARDVYGMNNFWCEVRALDNRVQAATQDRLLLEGRKLIDYATRWLLRRATPIDMAATVSRLATGISLVADRLPDVLPADGQRAHRALTGRLMGQDVPESLAVRVASFDALFSALDIVEVALAENHPVETVASTYFLLADRLQLRWLRDRIKELPAANRWQTLARQALRDDLYGRLREITVQALAFDGVQSWLDHRVAVVQRCRQVMGDIRASGTFNLVTLSVGVSATKDLVGT